MGATATPQIINERGRGWGRGRGKGRYMMNLIGKFNEARSTVEDGISFPDQIIFNNPQAAERFDPTSTILTRKYCRMFTPPSIHCCSNLVLVVSWATVCCLRKLQVWGLPSKAN